MVMTAVDVGLLTLTIKLISILLPKDRSLQRRRWSQKQGTFKYMSIKYCYQIKEITLNFSRANYRNGYRLGAQVTISETLHGD
jgi:hypothetical protein